jgi:hypothetical protein
MKKIICLLIALLTVIIFVSCGKNVPPKETEVETEAETKVNTPSETEENKDNEQDAEKNKNGILKINPDDYYKCVVWELPEGNFRDVAVDYMRKQANVEWVCENGFSVIDKFEHWYIGLEYKKGVTYHGITYTNAKSSYDEFMLFYKDGKVKMESGDSNAVVGNGCFSSTQNATQQFDPDVAGVTDVLMPSYKVFEAKIVGDYKVPENVKRTEDIKLANSEETIYNAYAQLKKGDIIFQKDDTKGMSHVRMLVEDPTIFTNATGKFVASRSSVKTIEQTNAFDKTRTDGVNTTWYVDHIYSFSKLYETNYLPVTYESYEKDRSEMEKPYLLLDDEISASILAKKTFSSTVKSNFPIRFVKVDILDKDNNVVSTKLKNNMEDTRSIPLRNHFSGVFNKVPNGEYTMVLTAGISRGSTELARVEFTIG